MCPVNDMWGLFVDFLKATAIPPNGLLFFFYNQFCTAAFSTTTAHISFFRSHTFRLLKGVVSIQVGSFWVFFRRDMYSFK